MIESALGVLAILTIYYVYFITRIRIGLLSLRSAKPIDAFPMVSVIIAVRNEERAIDKCLRAINDQTYHKERYEIIVVDDGSTDRTAEIIRSFIKANTNIHLLSLPAESAYKTGRKPLAISHGVAFATGNIILTTDADCIPPHRWIEIMVSHFTEDVVFAAGPVAEQVSASFFSKLEYLEFLGLITTAAGLIGSGRPIICNGANLAYRKEAFGAVGGFGPPHSSNDDESLMNRMVERKVGRIVFVPDADAVVTTKSSNTISSFFSQRMRWANKRGHYEDKTILFTLVLLYLFFLNIVIVAMCIPAEPYLIFPLGIVFCGKALVDFFTLRSGARMFKLPLPVSHFLVAELFHVPYIVITAALGQIASYQWKGRNIH